MTEIQIEASAEGAILIAENGTRLMLSKAQIEELLANINLCAAPSIADSYGITYAIDEETY